MNKMQPGFCGMHTAQKTETSDIREENKSFQCRQINGYASRTMEAEQDVIICVERLQAASV